MKFIDFIYNKELGSFSNTLEWNHKFPVMINNNFIILILVFNQFQCSFPAYEHERKMCLM